MKQCPRCNVIHEYLSSFCSIKCARSRTWSLQTQEKRAKSNRIAHQRRTLQQKQQTSRLQQISQMYTKMNRLFDPLPYDTKRKRVILEQDGKCNKCNNDIWLGESLRLELDHIDGNHSNNTRDNLRALCPNCHSTTPTWRGKTTSRQWNCILRLLEYKREMDGASAQNRTEIPH